MTNLAIAAAQLSLSYGQALAKQFANTAMNSLVVITRPDVADYDETTREYTAATTMVIYDALDELGAFTGAGDIAGITQASGPITFSVGDEPTYYESLTVHIPADCPTRPRIDDMVTVMASPDDDLAGRVYRITDVPTSGRINASTTLSCVGIAPSRQWTP